MKRCTTCKELRPLDLFCKRKISRDGLNGRCKICERKRNSEYCKANRSAITNRELKRYHSDPKFKAILHARMRVTNFLKRKEKLSKSLGCTFKEFKNHIESQFQPGMAWENYGQWHIDHKYPLSVAYSEGPEFFKKSCNYKNLQPLWAHDNLKKSNKVI